MLCKKCGNQISDGEKFCSKCGAKISPAAEGKAITKDGIKGKRKLLVWVTVGIVAAVIALVVVLQVFKGGYSYKVNGDTVVITGYRGNPVELVIPEKIGGKVVTEIGDRAFNPCTSLESISIPESMTGIEFGVFQHCESLQSISIPKSVLYIDGSAFINCSNLKSITLPDGLTSIGKDAFAKCSSLESIQV